MSDAYDGSASHAVSCESLGCAVAVDRENVAAELLKHRHKCSYLVILACIVDVCDVEEEDYFALCGIDDPYYIAPVLKGQ